MILAAGGWVDGHGTSVLSLVAGWDHAAAGQHPAAARSAPTIRRGRPLSGCSAARKLPNVMKAPAEHQRRIRR
jgi:hypothetical protein